MKILITGKTGLLGASAIGYFSKFYKTVGIGRDDIDYANTENLTSILSSIEPDVILHCAANTNVEQCELDPNEAYHDNVLITEKIASYCANKNIKMIFISSTGVYGSHSEEPYTEFDLVSPTTKYHHSKVIAEKSVMNIVNKHLIIRTGWLFTSNPNAKKNFIKSRVQEAFSSHEIISDGDQLGNPTYDLDLLSCLHQLLKLEIFGIFNCVNEGRASRYEYVKEIIKGFSINSNIRKESHSFFKRKAPVSLNESALNLKLNLGNIYRMRHWKSALFDAITEIQRKDL